MTSEPGDGDWSLRGKYFGASDVLISLVSAVVFLALRPLLVNRFFRPFGLRMKNLRPEDQLSEKSEQELQKFCKYCWHTCVYLVFWIWALWLYLPLPWAFRIDAVWEFYPNNPEGVLPFKMLFLMEGGWYLHGIVESYYYDYRRTDFLLLMTHHLLAVLLCYGSLWGNAHRAGITVIVAQDLSDIIIYVSKIINQCVAVPFCQRWSLHTFLLTCITVSWFYTRVYFLGLLAYRAWASGLDWVPNNFINSGALIYGHRNFDPFSLCLAIELEALHILQIIWFVGILKMFLSQILLGAFKDVWYDSDMKHLKNGAHTAPEPGAPRPTSKKAD